jgi:hypothetical protein
MKISGRINRTILIVIGSIILAIGLVILLASPLGKYLGKKYGEKYTGRQIKMGLVYVNPFTGYVHISNLVIYESNQFSGYKKGDSIFFSAKSVSAKFTLRKLLSKTIELSEITLNNPKGIIIQNGNKLNFSDWILSFAPKHTPSANGKVHFSILKIKIVNGEFHYREEMTPINYFITHVNIESTGKRWNSDTLALNYSFASGPAAGTASGAFSINFRTLDYRIQAIIEKYDLKFLEQYFRVLVDFGTVRASTDANIKATGNFRDLEMIDAKGLLTFNDFHLGKNSEDDYAAFDRLVFHIVQLNPAKHQYIFDSISLKHPFFKYERYDYLDNLQMMFGENGTNLSQAKGAPERFNLVITIADYIKGLVKNFFQSEYKINRLAIYNGDFRYNDFATSEKFSIAANPLNFLADSVDRHLARVKAYLKSGIQPFGSISVNLDINPKNKGDFDVHYSIKQIPASVFNPYLITYTSFPLDRGTLEITGTWNVRNEMITSVNHLVIIDPRTSKRLRNQDKKWLPLPLIMSLVRERGNVIDYQIPITGNLNDPKFHLHDVLMDLLTNIFVKPATTAYRVEVRNMEGEIEQSHSLTWKTRVNSLQPGQEEFVSALAEFLAKNPEASISVFPMQYADKEKEYICFFEAKKKYYLLTQKVSSFSRDDSLKVDKMSVKDSLFVYYLNNHENNVLVFTIQEKCLNFTGSAVVDAKFQQLNRSREDAFMLDFKKRGVNRQVKFLPGENHIPYNGFSFYKIASKGELSPALIKAYRKMNELNDEAPRKQYKKERKQNKNALTESKP